MAKSPKKPKLSTGKASKPELKPLDTYLADLLNPAVNREREEAEGFAERAQAAYAQGQATDVDPALAKKLGLRTPDDGPDVPDDSREDTSLRRTAFRPRCRPSRSC
jgi:excinuclease ABC subunit B